RATDGSRIASEPDRVGVAKPDRHGASAARPRDDGELRPVEREFGQAAIVDLSGGENALWGGIAEELEPGLDALSRNRADAFPGSVRAAPEQAVLRASDDFYRDDVLDRPTRKHAGGPEPVKAGLRPLAGEG